MWRHQLWYAAPPVKHFVLLISAVAGSLGFLACSDTTPPASPPSDVRDVRVHRADDKPDFVRLEREGDPIAALAAAYMHGAGVATSRTIGKYVAQQLEADGYSATVTPTNAAVLVSIALDESKAARARTDKNLVHALRAALELGRKRALAQPEDAPRAPNPCGDSAPNAVPNPPGHDNTVLAAVGTSARLASIHSAYEADTAWPRGGASTLALPERSTFTTSPSTAPAQLQVAVRTAQRQRVLPASRAIADSSSLLSLMAESYDGHWTLRSSSASFVPGGGCLTAHLEAQRPVAAPQAARAARAILRELDWVLNEQTKDEDPRFDILEAPNAEDSARRAAWEAATRRHLRAQAASTVFVQYRGDVDTETWNSLLSGTTATSDLPIATRDERGQGRVWAMLENRCSLIEEDNETAGHTIAALLTMARSTPRSRLDVLATGEHQALVGWEPTQVEGAEDRLAETLARSVLETVRSPALATQLIRSPQSLLDEPQWTLALTLATNGHPSWLSTRSTPQARALFDGGALEAAARRFAQGPLQVRILTNRGQAQATRLGSRLAHLLSGLHTSNAACSSRDVSSSPPAAGEYEIATPNSSYAVALYVVDKRFSDSVRHLADALNRPDGWLRRGVEPLGAHVTATALGTPATMAAIGFTVSAEGREEMDSALAQLRVLVADLIKAPLTSLAEPARESEPSGPVDRLVRLGDDEKTETRSDASDVRALITEGLTERRLVVVRPLAPPKATHSSKPK